MFTGRDLSLRPTTPRLIVVPERRQTLAEPKVELLARRLPTLARMAARCLADQRAALSFLRQAPDSPTLLAALNPVKKSRSVTFLSRTLVNVAFFIQR